MGGGGGQEAILYAIQLWRETISIILVINAGQEIHSIILYAVPIASFYLSLFYLSAIVFFRFSLPPPVCTIAISSLLIAFWYVALPPYVCSYFLVLSLPSVVCHCLLVSVIVSCCLPLLPGVCRCHLVSVIASCCLSLLPGVCLCLLPSVFASRCLS